MSQTLQGIIEGAVAELREHVENLDHEDRPGFLEDPDYDGTLHEIADGSVPVYNSDILAVAADDNEVALRKPDIGPAFDGSPTPINIIAANIYELVSEALYEEVAKIKEECEDDEGAGP